ncbi:MAG: hypothetical protein QOD69_2077, partial [Solirubrobacteraceae bacterium]|nr:hypothetical protein [Solirubrobacteraceae bacterium]
MTATTDARQVLALRRSLGAARPSRSTVLWWLYLGVILGGLTIAMVWGSVQAALRALGPGTLAAAGPACFAACLLAAARFGLWQGPVAFSAADCAHLLTAPLARDALVAPRLRMGLLAGAGAGLALGALVVAGGVDAHDLDLTAGVAALVAAAALGVLGAALAWLVEASPRVAAVVAAGSPPALAALAGLLAAGLAGGAAREIALWSGPWGWPLLGVAHGAAGGVAGAALALVAAAAAVLPAWRRAGACPLERFVARSATTSALVAALGSYDARTAGVVRRRALSRAAAQVPSQRLPAPWLSGPARAPARRDLQYLRRAGGHTLVAAVLGGGAGAAVATGDRAWPAAGCLAAYVAAAALLEPARMEVDVPSRAALLTPWRLGRLLWLHAPVPAACLALCAIAGAAAASIAGVAAPGAALAAVVLAPPLALGATLCAALVVRRGGRVPITVLLTAMADPSGGVTVLAWLLAGPLAVVAVGSALLA